MSRSALALAAIACVPSLAASAAEPAWTTYQDASLGVEFLVQPTWPRLPCSELDIIADCIAFNTADSFSSVVQVTVESSGLEPAIERHALFERNNGKWEKHGRVGKSDAIGISGDGWTGIYAVTSCPIEDPDLGTLWSAGECLTAIVSDGARAATVETRGSVSPDEIMAHLVRRFRFTGD